MAKPKKREKVWKWNGEVVSKTTYFRRKADDLAKAAKGSLPENQFTKMTEDDQRGALSPAAVAEKDSLISSTDDALIRDFMVGWRAIRKTPTDPNLPYIVTPRLYIAVVRLLEHIGY